MERSLTALFRQLEVLLADPDWDRAQVNPISNAMVDASRRASADELAHVAAEMARFIRLSPAQEAGIVALCAGTLTEYGAPPHEIFAALSLRLPQVLGAAGRLVRAVNEAFPESEEEREPTGDDDRWVGSVPVPGDWFRDFASRDREAAGAFNTLDHWCLPVISIATRDRPLLEGLVSRQHLRDAVAPLAWANGNANFLLTLLCVPLEEPLLFVHTPTKRAFSLVMDGVPNNFALHTLLSDVLAAALGHNPPPTEVVACIRGDGSGSCPTPNRGTWNLYTWKAVRHLPDLDSTPWGEDWVWNEGRPADIPLFEGTRVLLAGNPTIQRSWNTRRVFHALPAEIRLGHEIGERETRALLKRMQDMANR